MNDNDPRDRPARLEQSLAQARLARQKRTTILLLRVIVTFVVLLTVVFLRRYEVF